MFDNKALQYETKPKSKDKIIEEQPPFTFQIEKNVPMPTWYRNSSEGYNGKYPFNLMKIGDSFLIPTAPVLAGKIRDTVSSATVWYRKRYDKRFHIRTRAVTGGVRVWCSSRTNGKTK
tara:strand:- start:260 stop:613 length:354 start_codon:yes stop_codon:yes gene_type:complete